MSIFDVNTYTAARYVLHTCTYRLCKGNDIFDGQFKFQFVEYYLS